MLKYIIKNNEFIPIILQGRKLAEIEFEDGNYVSNRIATQFPIEMITNLEMQYYHGLGRNLNRFYFGKGFLRQQNTSEFIVIFCEENKAIVKLNWAKYYPSEFNRLKRALKAAGYNTRKCITFVDDFRDFFYDVLSPKMEDYQEEYQKQISSEFIKEYILELTSE